MLIFDLDGTLWETLDTTLEAANMIAKENPEVKENRIKLLKEANKEFLRIADFTKIIK